MSKSRKPLRHVEDLTPDPANRRAHNPRNIGMVVDALKDVGAARSIVIDEDGVVLAGNGVAEAATQAGITKLRIIDAQGDELIAVRRKGLTPEKKRSLAIYDNRAGELATWNVEQLRADQVAGQDLSAFWRDEEIAALLTRAPKSGLTDPDATPEPRATTIKLGHLFELGEHRLLCGDAEKADAVAGVLQGIVPQLMVTDPPYAVQYDPTWRAKAGVNRNTKKLGKVQHDDRADWTDAWRHYPGPIAYVWHGGLKASIVQASLERVGFAIRSQIIWAKDRMALSRGDYHWQHEPCWYVVRGTAASHRTDDRTQTTIWEIASTLWRIPAREDDGHGHSTQKPVECMARPIRNHNALTVYEPFMGSGTTLIAAEQLSRRCFGIELDPTYVQIAIDRWEAFTGQKAKRVATAVGV